MALDVVNTGNVDAGGNIKVALTNNQTYMGGVRMFSENDAGTITGTPYLQPPETSDDYRLRVGVDTLLLDHTFSETSVDTTAFRVAGVTTMTAALSGGFLTLNAGAATVSGNYITYSSCRNFTPRGTSPLYVEITCNFSAIPITNQVIEFGLYQSVASAAPADGVWFQITSAGVIGVMCYNGTVTQSGVLLAAGSIPIGSNQTYLMTVGQGYVEFWIDNVLYGEIIVPAGQATPFLTDGLPVSMTQRNSGVVAASPQCQFKIGDVVVTCGDISTYKPWSQQMAGLGGMGSQAQAGATMGSTAALPNATAATTVTGAALSQSAAIATGLGGQAGIIAAVPGIDGLITAYQNPVGSVTQPPRSLVITGVRISAVNIGAAVATTASVLQWSLGYGATALSLATADTATVSAVSVKSHRRIPLGFSSFVVGAAIGAQAPDIVMQFTSPIVVNPGEYLVSVAKFIVGTATASQVIWCSVAFDAHWE